MQFLQPQNISGEKKVLNLTPEKCTGCRTCELACSFKHSQEFRPSASRVSVLTWESSGVSVPMLCLQCDNASCLKVCPTGAIARTESGPITINESRCLKCKMCAVACKMGNVGYDEQTHTMLKCDFCNGDPVCAKFCPSGAIAYEDAVTVNLKKKKVYAEKLMQLLQEGDSECSVG